MIEEANEELDVIKSLELTAEGSYEDGCREGRKEGIEKLRNVLVAEFKDKELLCGIIILKAENLLMTERRKNQE